MFDYTGVAVEVWEKILLEVIDLPYVLDTLTDRETDHWRHSSLYHDLKVYTESEHQRRTLRLVCRSWRDFADEYQYRWITYHLPESRNTWEHKYALEAIRLITDDAVNPNPQGTRFKSRPRRILLHITTDADMVVFRNTIDYCCPKVTTLFVKCVDRYRDQIFEYMIEHSSKLPMVRCLNIPTPQGHPGPLRAVSAAFPALTTFEMKKDSPYMLKEGDHLVLRDLEMLGTDISAFPGDSFRKWDLPGIIQLNTPVGRYPHQPPHITLEPIKSLGANLRLLNIWKAYAPIRLPVEFWTWCPCLVEFLSFFSWIFLDSPAPTGHPLKRVVHWGYNDDVGNPLATETPRVVRNPAVLHSLECLPPGVTHFVVAQTWTAYMNLLARQSLYSRSQCENILLVMNEICAKRSIRVEDQDRVALGEFLAK